MVQAVREAFEQRPHSVFVLHNLFCCCCYHLHCNLVLLYISADVAKHKSLLARCMDNIRGNKERITVLTQERDVATAHLQDKIKQLDIIKVSVLHVAKI